MKICTFAGHGECRDADIAYEAERAVKRVIEQNDAVCFYCGGMGDFDTICETTVRDMKRIFPEKKIRLSLVMPFYTREMDYQPERFRDSYDEVIVPDALSQYDSKRRIPLRNEWMVDHADELIAYITHNSGGAWNTYRHAIELSMPITNLSLLHSENPLSFEASFGRTLTLHRRLKALSVEALAKASSLDAAYLERVENAQRNPTLETILKLSEIFGCAPHTLFEETERLFKLHKRA